MMTGCFCFYISWNFQDIKLCRVQTGTSKCKFHCLCVKLVGACPFDDEFVPNPVLAGYCLSCAPEFGFCKPPFNAAWLAEYEKKNGGPVGGAPTVEIGV